MELIDTHTHLFSDSFHEDREEVIQRALDCGIKHMLLPNIDVDSLVPMFELSEKHPGTCIPMVGLHPGSVNADVEAQLSIIKPYLSRPNIVAIGEIGMDLYWDKTFVEEQKWAFREQVKWAKALKLPIAIHARDAFEPIFEILEEENTPELHGVFHCFTGELAEVERIQHLGGFYFGIGGVLTYKKSTLPEVVAQIDVNQLILETDSPYLPPHPFRGKRNESSYLVHIAEKLSDVHALPLREIARITTNNARNLFNLPS